MIRRQFSIVLLLATLGWANAVAQTTQPAAPTPAQPAASAQPAGPAPHDNLNATLWTQQSVEFKANAMAVFDLARIRLDQGLKDRRWTAAPAEQKAGYEKLPPALIVDIDETVLDNSPYQVWMLKNGKTFSQDTWAMFCKTETSLAIPGAVEFLRYAASKGVRIFYVSNRNADLEQATRNNLRRFAFPIDEREDTVLLAGEKPEWRSEKGTRRSVIAERHRIILNLGDNFGDFVDAYRGDPQERQAILNNTQGLWGRQWLMIANPTYGSFEGSPFKGNFRLPQAEQRQAKLNSLFGWDGK